MSLVAHEVQTPTLAASLSAGLREATIDCVGLICYERNCRSCYPPGARAFPTTAQVRAIQDGAADSLKARVADKIGQADPADLFKPYRSETKTVDAPRTEREELKALEDTEPFKRLAMSLALEQAGPDFGRSDADLEEPEESFVNPKEIAGSRKPAIWNVVPRWIILLVGRVMQVGAAKYGRFNYRNTQVSAMTYVDAIERHMQLWQDGEDDDPETGVSHLASVIAGAAILLDAQAIGMMGDDRPKTGQARKQLDALQDLLVTLPLPATFH